MNFRARWEYRMVQISDFWRGIKLGFSAKLVLAGVRYR